MSGLNNKQSVDDKNEQNDKSEQTNQIDESVTDQALTYLNNIKIYDIEDGPNSLFAKD